MLEVMLMALGTEQVTLGTMRKSEIRVAEPEPYSEFGSSSE
jgi:hypothetical protein